MAIDTQRTTTADKAKRYNVIDADAHVNPPVELWKDYLPKHLRDLAPRFEEGTAEEPNDWVTFEGKRTPVYPHRFPGGHEA